MVSRSYPQCNKETYKHLLQLSLRKHHNVVTRVRQSPVWRTWGDIQNHPKRTVLETKCTGCRKTGARVRGLWIFTNTVAYRLGRSEINSTAASGYSCISKTHFTKVLARAKVFLARCLIQCSLFFLCCRKAHHDTSNRDTRVLLHMREEALQSAWTHWMDTVSFAFKRSPPLVP